MGWSNWASRARMRASTSPWFSWVPWLKFNRNTSTPASSSWRNLSGSELAGPTVATILVRRCRRKIELSPAMGPTPARRLHQDGPEVVDVGQRRPGNHQIVQTAEESVAVVVRKMLLRTEPHPLRA